MPTPAPIATPPTATCIHAVCFDVGGTLLRVWPSVGEVYAEVMASHGVHFQPAELDAAFGRAWRAASLTPRVGIDAAAERAWWHSLVVALLRDLGHHAPIDAMFDALWDAFAEPERWRLHAGAEATLLELRRRGYRLAVLSNWDTRLRPLLERLALDTHFETLVISAEVGMEKPDPRIFHEVARRLDLPAGAILHVGDSEHHDAAGSAAAGWPGLLVTHRPAPGAPGPGRIHALGDLLDLLPAPGAPFELPG